MRVTSNTFVKEFAKATQTRKEIIDFVIKGYNEWMMKTFKRGDTIQLPFGRFDVVKNRPGFGGKIVNSKRLRFTAFQRFKKALNSEISNIGKDDSSN